MLKDKNIFFGDYQSKRLTTFMLQDDRCFLLLKNNESAIIYVV